MHRICVGRSLCGWQARNREPFTWRIRGCTGWARVREYRQGENPARFGAGAEQRAATGTLKVRKVEHRAALPYAMIYPGFHSRRYELEEGIGTAVRVRHLNRRAHWQGDRCSGRKSTLLDKIWTSAKRMKAEKEHRVPLSPRTRSTSSRDDARQPAGDAVDAFVFPGGKPGRPLSNMSFLMLLRRMNRSDLTAHGFVVTPRLGSKERTNFQVSLRKWRSLMRSATKWRQPTVVAICLRSVVIL